MIVEGHEVLSTREIVERLMSTERAKRTPDIGYVQALEDVIWYDEQHESRRRRVHHMKPPPP